MDDMAAKVPVQRAGRALPMPFKLVVSSYMVGYAILFLIGSCVRLVTLLNALELLSILVGMLAATLLFWSSSMASGHLKSMAEALVYSGASPKLVSSDKWMAVTLFGVCVVIGTVGGLGIYSTYHRSGNIYRLAVQAEVLTLFLLSWPVIFLAGMFWFRRAMFKKAEELKRVRSANIVIRKLFQLWGFVLLIVAGSLQSICWLFSK